MRTELRQNIYHGSPTWETSVANRDLIKDFTPPTSNSISTTIAWKFEFYAKDDITISINGSDPIFLASEDEMIEEGSIWSFVLLDSGKTFRYIARL